MVVTGSMTTGGTVQPADSIGTGPITAGSKAVLSIRTYFKLFVRRHRAHHCEKLGKRQ